MNQRLAVVAAGVVLCILLVYLFASGTFQRMFSGSGDRKTATSNNTPSPANAAAGAPATDASAGPSSSPTGSATAIPTVMPVQNFSEQDLQTINGLQPQEQAERLMMAAVNHYDGAAKMVMDRVDG